MALRETNPPPAAEDDEALALAALAWTLAEPERAQRLLAVTGIDPADLRARAGDRDVLAAVVGFLAAHEPDLVACAAAIELAPPRLALLAERLQR